MIKLSTSIPMIFQKQPCKCVLIRRYSENMQQIYRRTPMPKSDFNEEMGHFWRPNFHFSKKIFLHQFFLVSCPMTDIKLSLKWLFCNFEKNLCPKWGICGVWMAGELAKWASLKLSVKLFRFFWNFTSWWRVLKIGYKIKLIFCSKLGKTGILEHINIKVWQYLFLFLGKLILCPNIPLCFTFSQNLFIEFNSNLTWCFSFKSG